MRDWGVTDVASGSQRRLVGVLAARGRSRLRARERPEPERGRGAGRRGLAGGVASEPICRPRAQRAGHQLPAPLLRPDEPAQRGHRSPARSGASPSTDPRSGPRGRLGAARNQMEKGGGVGESSELASL